MTTFLLIRHATTDAVGKSLAGRKPGVRLNAKGRTQAEVLAARLTEAPIASIYSSPLERARETAEPLARQLNLEVQICNGLNEIHFGEWTGRKLEELAPVPEWQRFNCFRSGTRIPGGELMLEAQARVITELERLREKHPGEVIAVITHGDLIKAAIAHYAGVHLDLFQRIEIDPASVSIVVLSDYGPRILRLNDTGALPSL